MTELYNGDKYFGQWLDDHMTGLGMYTKANGVKHLGNFQNGKFEGEGIQVRDNTDIVRGIWI